MMMNWTLPLALDRVLEAMNQPQEAREPYVVPRADVIDAGDAYRVVVELPGVDRDGLKIDFEGETLTVRGSRLAPEGKLLVDGRGAGRPFLRTFTIGGDIARDQIAARLENGLLTVTLPRKEEVKPRRIEVEVQS
jgi:HSP20 family protein